MAYRGSGRRLDVSGDVPFPMASTFKIPILATACKQLADGAISLEARVKLADEDKSMGSGILPYFESGLEPTCARPADLDDHHQRQYGD